RARAQQRTIPVIGWLHTLSRDRSAPVVAAFREGLRAAHYVEGQNVAIEYRWADGQYERLPELAADLARRKVNVIVTGGGSPAALAAKTSDFHDSDRFRHRLRSGGEWDCSEPGSAGCQCHGRQCSISRAYGEAAAADGRTGTQCQCHRATC